MNITKLTIRTLGKKNMHLYSPSQEIILSELTAAVSPKTTLPNRIIRKICRESHVPNYVNYECFKPSVKPNILDLNG